MEGKAADYQFILFLCLHWDRTVVIQLKDLPMVNNTGWCLVFHLHFWYNNMLQSSQNNEIPDKGYDQHSNKNLLFKHTTETGTHGLGIMQTIIRLTEITIRSTSG